MAEWIDPKTDWNASDYCTVTDFNRIYGNVVYLLGGTDRTFTQNDIITLNDWSYVRDNLNNLAEFEGVELGRVDNRVTFDNFNVAESIAEALKTPIDRRKAMKKANHYSGQYYAGSYIHVGGAK